MLMQVLIADPDRETIEQARNILTADGYTVIGAGDGDTAWQIIDEQSPDLVLLDLQFPARGGLGMLAEIRQRAFIPLIIMALSSQEEQALEALHLGADDYVVKPLRPQELRARTHALLRRTKEWMIAGGQIGYLQSGGVTLDLRTREARVDGKSVRLSRTEFALLEYLMLKRDGVIQLPDLAANVWGYSDGKNQNVVKVAISRLRRKIEPDPDSPRYIVNIPGVGYMFRAESDGSRAA